MGSVRNASQIVSDLSVHHDVSARERQRSSLVPSPHSVRHTQPCAHHANNAIIVFADESSGGAGFF
jgi:hypothetical protein